MKKLQLSFLALTMMCLATVAQNTRVGLTAGVAIANYNSKVDGNDESGNSKAGITAGILVDVPIGKSVSFQPALNYVQKGTKDEETFAGITEEVKLNVDCIEVPLNILFNSTSNSGTFFVGGGPSFGFNLSGKLKYDDGTNSESEKIEIGNDPDNDFIKGLDIGANILAGYRFPNGLFVSAGYNRGLSNLFPGGDSDGKLKSSYFSVKLGWLFNGKKDNK